MSDNKYNSCFVAASVTAIGHHKHHEHQPLMKWNSKYKKYISNIFIHMNSLLWQPLWRPLGTSCWCLKKKRKSTRNSFWIIKAFLCGSPFNSSFINQLMICVQMENYSDFLLIWDMWIIEKHTKNAIIKNTNISKKKINLSKK